MTGDRTQAAGGGPRPGARLGLPASGRGRLASWGIRIAALFLDWIMCLLVSSAFASRETVFTGGGSLLPLLVLVAETTLFTSTLGGSAGQILLGVRVRRLDGARSVGLLRSLLRSVLIALVVPAVVVDADRRGLHDRAVGTVVVRSR